MIDLDKLSMQEFYDFQIKVGNYPIHEAVIRFATMKEKENEEVNYADPADGPHTAVGPERGDGTG